MDSESDEWSDSSTDSDLEHLKPKTLVNVPPSMQKKLLKSKYYLPPEMKRPTVELCDGETQTMISGSLQMKLCFTESGQRKKKKMKIRRYGVNVRHSGSQTTSTGIVFSVERDGIGGYGYAPGHGTQTDISGNIALEEFYTDKLAVIDGEDSLSRHIGCQTRSTGEIYVTCD